MAALTMDANIVQGAGNSILLAYEMGKHEILPPPGGDRGRRNTQLTITDSRAYELENRAISGYTRLGIVINITNCYIRQLYSWLTRWQTAR